MNEQEKEAIKDTKDILEELNKHKDKDFIGRLYYKNKPIEDILQILLNLIEKQQKEIEEKEKVIDEMAKQLVDLPIPISQEENILFFNSFDVKRFFYKKIKKK